GAGRCPADRGHRLRPGRGPSPGPAGRLRPPPRQAGGPRIAQAPPGPLRLSRVVPGGPLICGLQLTPPCQLHNEERVNPRQLQSISPHSASAASRPPVTGTVFALKQIVTDANPARRLPHVPHRGNCHSAALPLGGLPPP